MTSADTPNILVFILGGTLQDIIIWDIIFKALKSPRSSCYSFSETSCNWPELPMKKANAASLFHVKKRCSKFKMEHSNLFLFRTQGFSIMVWITPNLKLEILCTPLQIYLLSFLILLYYSFSCLDIQCLLIKCVRCHYLVWLRAENIMLPPPTFPTTTTTLLGRLCWVSD